MIMGESFESVYFQINNQVFVFRTLVFGVLCLVALFSSTVYMEALLGMTRGGIILDVIYFSKKRAFF
jgi:uncharacterized membrane protein